MRSNKMKYLSLDTNIYIDMIVSRENDHKPDSYKRMEKLLKFDQIKLLVPKLLQLNSTDILKKK